jgi:hypothetical protein
MDRRLIEDRFPAISVCHLFSLHHKSLISSNAAILGECSLSSANGTVHGSYCYNKQRSTLWYDALTTRAALPKGQASFRSNEEG